MTAQVLRLPLDVDQAAAHSPLVDALDQLEQTAADLGILGADVLVQLALARHLVAITSTVRLDGQPSVAQVHALRELRLTITELRQLIVDYARRRR